MNFFGCCPCDKGGAGVQFTPSRSSSGVIFRPHLISPPIVSGLKKQQARDRDGNVGERKGDHSIRMHAWPCRSGHCDWGFL